MIRIPRTVAQGVLALGLLLMLASLLEAMDSNGIVTNVDPAIRSITVLDDQGEVRTYRLRADGEVFIDGTERSIDDLRARDWVTISYDLVDKEWIAILIDCSREQQ